MISSTYNSIHKLQEGQYFVINSLTGAIDVFGKEVKEVLDRISNNMPLDSDSDTQELVNFFLRRGYVYESRAIELDKLYQIRKVMNLASMKSKGGVTFNVCTTYACNLRCSYCFQDHSIHEQSHALEPDQINKMFEAVDKIIQMESDRGRFIGSQHKMMLYGGEPFLTITKKAVSEVVQRAIEHYGFRMYAITNGTQLHEFLDMLEPFKESWDFFQISLDGPQKIHDSRRITAGGKGTFVRIVKNISDALRRGFGVAVRTNVNKDNVEYLEELADFIEQQGWNTMPNFAWQISPVTDHFGVDLPNHLPEHELLVALYKKFGDLDSFMHKFNAKLGTVLTMRTSRIRESIRSFNWDSLQFSDSCALGSGSVPLFKECSARDQRYYTFGTDGLIYPCPESVGRPNISIATFYPEYQINVEAHQIWDRDITDSEKCLDCSISLFCGGGCAFANLMRNGDIVSPYCNYAHETISTCIEQNKDKFIQLME
ncbi:radical SAM/SPASM domain-containing protein [Paenibacillus fonticola]|uniref:radical SAM/SPASM domain-containing protein n=1 Tax=Paenibacillus fonticola TaxID=379896 RepID=UPI00036B0729|nr:radical SAM protein [Paenibacillus fonticola]